MTIHSVHADHHHHCGTQHDVDIGVCGLCSMVRLSSSKGILGEQNWMISRKSKRLLFHHLPAIAVDQSLSL